jgi:hypothetical protein
MMVMMISPPPVFLFDIDGVLVEPLGYRKAVEDSLNYFTRRMGLGTDIFPTADLIALMESRQITSEWDMVPLSLGILLENLLTGRQDLRLPADLEAACQVIAQQRLPPPAALDYRAPVLTLGEALTPGEYPSATALRLSAGSPNGRLFTRLQWEPLLPSLLANTRELGLSGTTRLFQNICLGSTLFEQTYGLPALVEAPGTLSTYDRAHITPALRDELLAQWADGHVLPAAYTMRPSLPPRLPGEGLFSPAEAGFSPEAEIALDLTGLRDLPLVGYGRIRKLAQWSGAPAELYLKPSPVQALAAILAALGVDEARALREGLLLSQGLRPPAFGDASQLTIHVFEDSLAGIRAVKAAGLALENVGIHCLIHTWGIAVHSEKMAVLEAAGLPVFPDISTALRAAFATVSRPLVY